MSPSPMAVITEDHEALYNDACPDYDVAISRSNSDATSHGTGSLHWALNNSPAPLSIQRRPSAQQQERYLYTYNLLAGLTPLQFLISVEPASGRPRPGKYTFRLSFKANGIERPLGESVALRLKVDPRTLNFVVFVFPGKSSIPVGSLYSLRVWMRVNGVDHRLFGEDDLWVGKDLDFNSIADASFARLKSVDSRKQLYHAFVGRALVTFIISWQRVSSNVYKYSLDYEANGVGGNLFENFRMRFEGDPRTVTFLVYTVPIDSKPAGASHRLRVWLRSLVPLSSADPATSFALPFHDSYIYQRIFKSDNFKIGARLEFESLGNKMIMGFSAGSPQTIVVTTPTPEADRPKPVHSP